MDTTSIEAKAAAIIGPSISQLTVNSEFLVASPATAKGCASSCVVKFWGWGVGVGVDVGSCFWVGAGVLVEVEVWVVEELLVGRGMGVGVGVAVGWGGKVGGGASMLGLPKA